jgi:hypothetical protein
MTYLLLPFNTIFAENFQDQLSQTTSLTVNDLLDLRLQILSAQMACGNYKIIDMGSIKFPVSIKIEDFKIVFEIEGKLKPELSSEIKDDIMKENMKFVYVAISELIRMYFSKLYFNKDKNIVGYWYYILGRVPHAKWENGEFIALQ